MVTDASVCACCRCCGGSGAQGCNGCTKAGTCETVDHLRLDQLETSIAAAACALGVGRRCYRFTHPGEKCRPRPQRGQASRMSVVGSSATCSAIWNGYAIRPSPNMTYLLSMPR